LVHAENFSAIASGGNVVAFTSTDGPHDVDLYAITRGTSGWGKPILLTNSSTYSRNEMPAFSSNGETVLFDCVNTGDPGSGSICEANVDGSGMRVVTTPADKPAGIAADGRALHHADYTPEGNFVYEGDWDGEMIYSLAAGSKTPKVVNNQYTNDNSPCVLPNGKIVSLWLNRPGGEGYHELKVMDSNGQNAQMVLQDIDVFDIGIGCGMDYSGGETNSALSPLLMLLIKDKKSQVESK
jgi:Tol biopolymer transport system component